MKKLFRKALCLTMATLVMMSTGCKPKKQQEQETAETLVIKVFDGGYSTSWLTKIATAFEEETGVDISIRPPVNDTATWADEIDSGISEVDLYFDCSSGFNMANRAPLTVNGVKYDTYLADLTDMYNTKVPGEDILYKDKMNSDLRNLTNYDYEYDYETKEYVNTQSGRWYTSYWANGSVSMVVNMESWNSSWGAFPNTTQELFAVCDKILADNAGKSVRDYVYPFGYSLETSYWKFLFETWSYQYMTEDEYHSYINGYDASGERYTKELVRYDGFLEALKVIEECLKYKGTDGANSYSHPYSTSLDFTTSQFYLLNGKVIMQPNGNWLISEMAANYKDADKMNIQFKKAPVVSSIINRCTTIADDAELSALITAIDNGVAALQGAGYDVDQADYDRIKRARSIVSTMANTHSVYIPAYSNNIAKAKEFLLYMAKDKCLEIYYQETMGSTLPFKYDYTKSSYTPSKLIQSEREMLKNSLAIPLSQGSGKYEFFSATGLNAYCLPYISQNTTEVYFSSSDASYRKTAQEIFDGNYEYLKKNWNTAYAPYAW